MRYRLRTLLIVLTLANTGVFVALIIAPVPGGTVRRAKVQETPTQTVSPDEN